MTSNNNIPQGYKKTDLGIIPEEWEFVNLGSISKINGRIGFRGYTVADLVPKGFGAITLSPSNIINGKINYKQCTYISWYKYKESPEIKVRDGDILLVKTGSTFGKSAFVKNLPQKATINPQFVLLNNFKCNNLYLSYVIAYDDIQMQINSEIVGGAIPTLSQEKIANFVVLLPQNYAEQKAIATALSDIDSLIDALDKKIAKKKLIKQGAMQQLLTGKKRLPGFTDDWVEKKLEDICDIIMGQSPSSIYYNIQNVGLPLIQGNADLENRQQIVRYYTSQITKVCEEGDVILSVRAPVGAVGKAIHKSCLGRGVCAIKINNDYIYHYLIYIEDDWNSFSKGSTFDSINSDELNKFSLSLPITVKEQQAIATILSDMDKEISDLETKLDKYRLIKQGMMQKLLTGQIRLKTT